MPKTIRDNLGTHAHMHLPCTLGYVKHVQVQATYNIHVHGNIMQFSISHIY